GTVWRRPWRAWRASSTRQRALARGKVGHRVLHRRGPEPARGGERAGVRRMVVASIIDIDRFSAGYRAAKLAHERAALSGLIPVRIVRAAQFHGDAHTAGRRQDRRAGARRVATGSEWAPARARRSRVSRRLGKGSATSHWRYRRWRRGFAGAGRATR